MQIEIDTHVHTRQFSGDSGLDMSELLSCLNDRKACITEHMDYGSYVKQDKKFCVEDYFKEYLPFRKNHIFLGIEIGMDTGYDEINRLNDYNFDYIIGSIHALKGENLYQNPKLYKTDKDTFFKSYFQYASQCLEKYSFVDSFAHFDYVSRYTPYENPVLSFLHYRKEYERLFDILLSNRILLEVNTRQIISLQNLSLVLEGYYKSGGRYVTLGSDAHSSSGLFKEFDILKKMIGQHGLHRACFIDRNMIPIE